MRLTAGQLLGLARSILIYYGRPFRVRKLAGFYAPFISPGDLCFDVGAHVGTHIHAFQRLRARVIAIEPQPLFYAFLTLLFRARPDLVLIDKALGASPGQAELRLSALTPTVSSLSESWIAAVGQSPGFERVTWREKIEVQVGTLDQLVQTFGKPAFCKIDAEGSEILILRGLTQPLPAISFEFTPAASDLAQECVQALASLGRYQFNVTVGERMRLLFPNWLSAPEVARWLDDLAPEGRSGDVIARLSDHS